MFGAFPPYLLFYISVALNFKVKLNRFMDSVLWQQELIFMYDQNYAFTISVYISLSQICPFGICPSRVVFITQIALLQIFWWNLVHGLALECLQHKSITFCHINDYSSYNRAWKKFRYVQYFGRKMCEKYQFDILSKWMNTKHILNSTYLKSFNKTSFRITTKGVIFTILWWKWIHRPRRFAI